MLKYNLDNKVEISPLTANSESNFSLVFHAVSSKS